MRKTVVVADDEPVVRHLVHATLALGAPVEVLEARTGAEALALVRRRPIDLLLLDVGMPELDGLETCRALKADPATRHIPVVFLSARAQPADRDAGAAAGASGYLTKPFSPRVLSETARRLLGP